MLNLHLMIIVAKTIVIDDSITIIIKLFLKGELTTAQSLSQKSGNKSVNCLFYFIYIKLM